MTAVDEALKETRETLEELKGEGLVTCQVIDGKEYWKLTAKGREQRIDFYKEVTSKQMEDAWEELGFHIEALPGDEGGCRTPVLEQHNLLVIENLTQQPEYAYLKVLHHLNMIDHFQMCVGAAMVKAKLKTGWKPEFIGGRDAFLVRLAEDGLLKVQVVDGKDVWSVTMKGRLFYPNALRQMMMDAAGEE